LSGFILTNALVVTTERVFLGSIRVEEGLVLDTFPGIVRGRDVVDCGGDYLLPGLVESHTDHLEKMLVPRPGVLWPSPLSAFMAHDAQMAFAGVTTVLDALCCGQFHESSLRRTILNSSVAAIDQAAMHGLPRADHFLHLRCELADPDMPSFFEPHAGHSKLRLVSLMDHTPGQRQFNDPQVYRRFFQSRANWTDEGFEMELPRLIADQKRHAGRNKDTVVTRCRRRGVPMASHDDASMDHVGQAHEDGVAISEFPTTLEAARRARELGMKILMGSPNVVRGASHTGNVSGLELAREGLLDILSSDYAPLSSLHAVFTLHRKLGLSLPEAAAMASATPAGVLGFSDRGSLTPGKRADVVRVSLAGEVPVVRSVWRAGCKVL
jgi:alpha-D-ribose 1-methylphosphonate 5-triphosphate diphosphatase